MTNEPSLATDGGAREAARPAVAPEASDLRVDMRGICKTFYGLAANADVDFDVRRGEVHALLGENGAGKSTLCSILAGLYRPDAGEVVVDGVPCRFRSPRDALAAGIGMVYQHYRLIDGFTVAENLALGHPQLAYRISPRAMERRAQELMERYDIHVDPRAYVGDLSVGEQQRVEILSVLGWDVDVLILDEPTAVLTPQESDRLFDAMRALAADGRGLVFVSHKLNEVLAVSDRITVLRDGRHVGTVDAADTDRGAIARMMVERHAADADGVAARAPRLAAVAPVQPVGEEPPALVVRGLRVEDDRGHEAVGGLDLDVRRGEIVGVAGVSGNGQRELADAIAGVRRAAAGSVRLVGRDVTRADARTIADAGLAYVPEDRLAMGVASGLSLEENLALRSYRHDGMSHGPLLSHRAQAREAKQLIERFGIRGVRPGLPVRVLSGGNVQRAILARELSGEPQLVIAASPSRGLDVGAARDVRALLREQRDRGIAVLVISEDLEELLELADRIVVLYEGRVAGETTAAEADTQQIGLWMAGSGEER